MSGNPRKNKCNSCDWFKKRVQKKQCCFNDKSGSNSNPTPGGGASNRPSQSDLDANNTAAEYWKWKEATVNPGGGNSSGCCLSDQEWQNTPCCEEKPKNNTNTMSQPATNYTPADTAMPEAATSRTLEDPFEKTLPKNVIEEFPPEENPLWKSLEVNNNDYWEDVENENVASSSPPPPSITPPPTSEPDGRPITYPSSIDERPSEDHELSLYATQTFGMFNGTTITEPTEQVWDQLTSFYETFYSTRMMDVYSPNFQSLELTNIQTVYDPSSNRPYKFSYQIESNWTDPTTAPSRTDEAETLVSSDLSQSLQDLWSSVNNTGLWYETNRTTVKITFDWADFPESPSPPPDQFVDNSMSSQELETVFGSQEPYINPLGAAQDPTTSLLLNTIAASLSETDQTIESIKTLTGLNQPIEVRSSTSPLISPEVLTSTGPTSTTDPTLTTPTTNWGGYTTLKNPGDPNASPPIDPVYETTIVTTFPSPLLTTTASGFDPSVLSTEFKAPPVPPIPIPQWTTTPYSSTLQTAMEIQNENEPFRTLLNTDRAALGLNPIEWSPHLIIASMRHSLDQFNRLFYDHLAPTDSPNGAYWYERAVDAGYNSTRVGENIAKGQGNGFDTPEKMYAGWKSSPGHWSNMIKPEFKVMGVAKSPSNFLHMWTQKLGEDDPASVATGPVPPIYTGPFHAHQRQYSEYYSFLDPLYQWSETLTGVPLKKTSGVLASLLTLMSREDEITLPSVQNYWASWKAGYGYLPEHEWTVGPNDKIGLLTPTIPATNLEEAYESLRQNEELREIVEVSGGNLALAYWNNRWAWISVAEPFVDPTNDFEFIDQIYYEESPLREDSGIGAGNGV